MIQVALVGCGGIAYWHARVVKKIEGVQICAVCDLDQYQAERIARMAGTNHSYTDYAKMLEEQKPDAVHILTPPHTHAELAIQAIESGAHVLIEKPFSMNKSDAEKIVAAADKAGVKVCTNHNYLYKPSMEKALQIVNSGQIGDVVHVVGYYGNSPAPLHYRDVAGNIQWDRVYKDGVFDNYLPHMIYLQAALLGKIKAVQGVTLSKIGDEEKMGTELNALLQGEKGSGVITITTRVNPYEKYVTIFGTRGIVTADLAREVCVKHIKSDIPGMVEKVTYNLESSLQLIWGTLVNVLNVFTGKMVSYPGLHRLIAMFYESLKTGGDLPVTAEDGMQMASVFEEIWQQAAKVEPILLAQEHDGNKSNEPLTEAEKTFFQHENKPGKVLVTGANGFLGRELVAALSRCGVDVVAMIRNRGKFPAHLPAGVELVQGDLRNPETMQAILKAHSVDMIFHCAAITNNKAPWRDHQQINIEGTRNVLEIATQFNIKRVVHVSSVVVYGLRRSLYGKRIPESQPFPEKPDHWAFYLRSKLEAEKVAQEFQRASSLPVVIVRPGIIYGPGGKQMPGKGLMQFGSFRIMIGNGRNKLPFVYIGNLVDSMLLAAVHPDAVGKIYTVVDEPQVRLRTLIQKSTEVSGESKIRIVPFPAIVFNSLALVLETFSNLKHSTSAPKISRFVVQSAVRNIEYGTDLAHSQLGWRSEISLEEGLRRTIQSKQ